MQKLQGMQGSVWHKPHCGVQVQPRLLPQVHQVSWTRLPQRTRRQKFLHLASLQKIEAPSSITAWTQIPYYYLQICSLVFVFTHFYLFFVFLTRFPFCSTRISKVGKCAAAFQLWTPMDFCKSLKTFAIFFFVTWGHMGLDQSSIFCAGYFGIRKSWNTRISKEL